MEVAAAAAGYHSIEAGFIDGQAREIGIGRDSARNRKVLACGEWAWAAVAMGFLSWSGPHDLQPQRCSGLSPCVLPAKLPDR
jgi:hypothetical protein